MIFQCKANRKAFDYDLIITVVPFASSRIKGRLGLWEIVRANAAETCRRTRRVQLMGARMLRKDNLRIAAYWTMPVYLLSFILLRPKHRRSSASRDSCILCSQLRLSPVLPNARIASRDDGSIMLKIR